MFFQSVFSLFFLCKREKDQNCFHMEIICMWKCFASHCVLESAGYKKYTKCLMFGSNSLWFHCSVLLICMPLLRNNGGSDQIWLFPAPHPTRIKWIRAVNGFQQIIRLWAEAIVCLQSLWGHFGGKSPLKKPAKK